MPLVYEGTDGVKVSGQEVLQELKVSEGPVCRVCRVCGEKATKELVIDIGVMDRPDHLYYLVEMVVYHFCDKHAYPYVEYRLSPMGK